MSSSDEDSDNGYKPPKKVYKKKKKTKYDSDEDYQPPVYVRAAFRDAYNKAKHGPMEKKKKKKPKVHDNAEGNAFKVQMDVIKAQKNVVPLLLPQVVRVLPEPAFVGIPDFAKPPAIAGNSNTDISFHLNVLRNNKPGSVLFMTSFRLIDEIIFGNNNKSIIVKANNSNLVQLDRWFNDEVRVIVIPKDDVHGFRAPKDFNFEKAKEIFKDNGTTLEVINSRTGETVSAPIRDIIKAIDEGSADDQNAVYNVLSLEVSEDHMLSQQFSLPTFVRHNSLVQEVDMFFEKVRQKFYSLNKNQLTGEKRGQKEAALREYEKFKKVVPRLEKYIIFSQADAFTDTHVDLSASAVFYFVSEGQKVIYFAPPTEENLNLYRELELDKKTIWECDQNVLRRFQRIVVEAGEVVFIPPGFLHFVYTPVNSLVIGGNFLTRRFIPLHFKITQLEEACLKIDHLAKNQMFRNFNETMFIWLKCAFFPMMEASTENRRSQHLIDIGTTVLHNLQCKKKGGPYFDGSEKTKMIEKLRKIVKEKDAEPRNIDNLASSIDFSYIQIEKNDYDPPDYALLYA